MAGSIIDRLIYVLGLDSKEFESKAAAADKKVGGMVSSFSRLTSVVGGLAAAFGAWKLADFIKDATLTAARTEVLGTVAHQVGESAGYSAVYIDELTEKIKAMGITTQVSRQAIVRFIQSELDLTQATKLARTAQDLAVISGQNSSEALQTIVEAIAAQRPILLKQFGIVKDLTEVYNTQAKALGKNADQLTELEKKQAFVNVILEAGAKVAGSYEAAMGDVGKQLTSLPRYFEELQNVIGELFLPALTEVIGGTTDLLKALRRALADELMIAGEDIAKLESTLQTIETAVPGLVKQFENLATTEEKTAQESEKLAGIQARIAALAPGLITELNSEGLAIGLNAEALAEYIALQRQNLETRRGAFAEARQQRIEELKQEREILLAQIEFREELEKLPPYDPRLKGLRDMPSLDEFIKEVTRLNQEIANLELAMLYAATGITEGMGAAKTSVAEMSDELTDMLKKLKTMRFADLLFPDTEQIDARLRDLKFQVDIGIISPEEYRTRLNELLKALEDAGQLMSDEWYKVKDASEQSFQEAVDNIITGPLEEFGREAAKTIGQTPWEDTADEAVDIWDDATERIADNMVRIVAQLDSEIGRVLNNIAAAIGSFAAGGPAGIIGGVTALFGVMSGIANLFRDSTEQLTEQMSESDRTNRELIKSQQGLIDAISQWTDELFRTTELQIQEQVWIVQDVLRRLREGTVTQEQALKELAAAGIDVPAWAEDWYLDQFLIDWLAAQERFEEMIRQAFDANNQAIRESILTATYQPDTLSIFPEALAPLLTFDDARQLIDFWVDQYNLTAQEQLELWESYLEMLRDIGALSADIEMRILSMIDNLREEIARQEASDEQKEQTQLSRSIARITERQADSLLSILQTIEYRLRTSLEMIVSQLNQIISGGIGAAAAGGGGTSLYFSGNFVFQSTSGQDAAQQFVRTINDQVRAAGGQVIFS